MEAAINSTDFKSHSKADRIGIFASVLCAIHCAVTPVFLILLPTFGKAWAHPSTHWGMALIVIPIAAFMMKKGYQRHGKKWILALGCIGIVLIIVGAILPYMESGSLNTPEANKSAVAAETAQPVEQPEAAVG